jgi:hypothetical protein
MLDFTPQVDDQVEVFGHTGRFVILDRKIGSDGNYRFKLKSLTAGYVLEDVTYGKLVYPPEERVRLALPRVLPECAPYPDDFQNGIGAYDIKTDEMYDGTPRVSVYFHLKPDVVPSVQRARIWNDFFSRLDDRFRFVDIDPERRSTWLQFTVKEGRSSLRAAS